MPDEKAILIQVKQMDDMSAPEKETNLLAGMSSEKYDGFIERTVKMVAQAIKEIADQKKWPLRIHAQQHEKYLSSISDVCYNWLN